MSGLLIGSDRLFGGSGLLVAIEHDDVFGCPHCARHLALFGSILYHGFAGLLRQKGPIHPDQGGVGVGKAQLHVPHSILVLGNQASLKLVRLQVLVHCLCSGLGEVCFRLLTSLFQLLLGVRGVLLGRLSPFLCSPNPLLGPLRINDQRVYRRGDWEMVELADGRPVYSVDYFTASHCHSPPPALAGVVPADAGSSRPSAP
ncbi:hypothetical protein TIFTF001_027233 [Ficus carica]|uniref:Uncharacterized protein n=1 Tax=Ficus carica TaxID=3494 RepID=A0AA88DMS5_FICCA|nr:hypothetical protein TIFTF001_027233 [Ficus carica]